jgi:nuclear transport factor 2 (NTF2) superfamily protein
MESLKKTSLTTSGHTFSLRQIVSIAFATMIIVNGINLKASAQDTIAPPFTQESAVAKLKINENVWNTRDPEKIAALYSPDAEWRDRTSKIKGRASIIAYLKAQFAKEADFKISKEVWGAKLSKNAIRFEEEWKDASTGQWYHSYGVEVVMFDDKGIIIERFASINDKPIKPSERSIN